jgi:hypothetical protein
LAGSTAVGGDQPSLNRYGLYRYNS